MGSFNTSCMVSGIEVDSKKEVLFLPFKINHQSFNKRGKVDYEGKAQSFWEGAETLFTPYLLPIKGTYDTYGSLENIEKNEYTDAIETHFGIEIEEFIQVLTCSRSYGDSYGVLMNTFIPKDILMIIGNYKRTFEEELEAFGFEIIPSDSQLIYKHPECSFMILLCENKDGVPTWTSVKKNGEEYTNDDRLTKSICGLGLSQDNYFLGVPKEQQSVVRELYGLSGAFVHTEMYELLSSFEFETQDEEKSQIHPVYATQFDSELKGLDVFMKNLLRSNRMLALSKYLSEWGSLEGVKFNIGLMDVILEEAKKINE